MKGEKSLFLRDSSRIRVLKDSLSVIPRESNNVLDATKAPSSMIVSRFCNMKNRNSLLLLSKLRCLRSYLPQEQGLFLPKGSFLSKEEGHSHPEKSLFSPKGLFCTQKRTFLHQKQVIYAQKEQNILSRSSL